MKTKTQIFVIALAMTLALAIAPTMAFGQIKILPLPQEQSNDLVGVWESVGPALNDCVTGLPAPDSPIIRVLQKFNQDGTMTEENTDPIEGPYRTTAHGIWERIRGQQQQYRAFYMHYSFAPDKTHIATVKIRSIITLSGDLYNEKGSVEVLDPQNNDKIFFTGCFNSGYTSTRLTF